QDGLWLRAQDQRWLNVPLPPDEDEQVSVKALGATIEAYVAARSSAAPPRRGPPGTLLCSRCDAPQAPAEAATVTCPFCGQRNPVPPELIDKMRALRTVAQQRARDDRLAAAIVAQRSARVANFVAFTGGLLVMAAAAVTLLGTAMFALIDGQ